MPVSIRTLRLSHAARTQGPLKTRSLDEGDDDARIKPICPDCGETFAPARRAIGYTLCLSCGETNALTVRHTVAPMHKSNYVLITDRALLVGLNNKQQR